ncbi:MAG: hypothetical protein EA357_09520 [Micavibrio sp.]|nr:MAG: hypothetical protein EA357_09520 [Micavibrio sp.]
MREFDWNLEQQIQKHAGKQTDRFSETLSLFVSLHSRDEADEEEAEFLLRQLRELPARDLTRRSGVLLVAAAEKGLIPCLAYLLKQGKDWPQQTVEEAAVEAAKYEQSDAVLFLLKNTDGWDGKLFQKLLSVAEKDHNTDLYDELEYFKKEHLGKNWHINSDYQITRKEEDDDYYEYIKTVFNFAACYVRTIIRDTDLETQHVSERDFRDFQSDGEITIAYDKLKKFSSNPPEYRGKDTGQNIRRIHKRETGRGL